MITITCTIVVFLQFSKESSKTFTPHIKWNCVRMKSQLRPLACYSYGDGNFYYLILSVVNYLKLIARIFQNERRVH